MTVSYGRPGSKAERTRRVVHALLLAQANQADPQRDTDPNALRTNGRFVFYELEQRSDARKPSPDDARPNRRRSIGWPPGAQDITDALTWLRECGLVPWGWITDESRTLFEWRYAETVLAYALGALDRARINPWGVEVPPLVLCESRATAAVLRYTTRDYAAPITGISFSAGFLRTEIAPLVAGNDRRVLYLGDLDRSGADIENNARRVLEREAGRELDWRRLAMIEDQAEGIEPIWKLDGRDRAGRWAWEVESLGQARLVQILRDELNALLPEPLDRVREREDAQRERVRAALKTL